MLCISYGIHAGAVQRIAYSAPIPQTEYCRGPDFMDDNNDRNVTCRIGKLPKMVLI